MSSREDSCIHIHRCPMYQEVSWEFDFPQDHASSPVFTHRNQSYKLELYAPNGYMNKYYHIILHRMGPSGSPERYVRLWAGLKRPDGTYYHSCGSGTLNLRSESENFYWVADLKSVRASELELQKLASEGRLTFFLRLLNKPFSAAFDSYVYGVADEPTRGDGKVLVETCQFHMVLHWEVHYEPFRKKNFCLVSPRFNFGHQKYRLELSSTRDEINLYRCGPSETGHIEWWVGLKLSDGSYDYEYENGQLGLKLDCLLSTYVKTLKNFETCELNAMHVGQDGNLTVVFLLRSNSRIPTAAAVCRHSANYMLPKVDGVIVEEKCPSHKEIEWNVHCEKVVLNGNGSLVSPIFSFGNQHYLLELSLVEEICLFLNLIRMGPSEEGSTRWLAGLKRADGTYYKRTESQTLKLKQNCEIWTFAGSLKTVTLSVLNAENLTKDANVKFFVRMSTDKESNIFNPGDLELFGCGEDSFREIATSRFKQVEWNVRYETSRGKWRLTSPAFQLLLPNRCYLFNLFCHDGFWDLHLISSPNPHGFQHFFIYWTGLKSSNGTYNHKIKSEKVNLRRDYHSWCRLLLLKQISQGELEKEHLSPNGIITIFLKVTSQLQKTAPESRTLDVAIVPTPGEGTIEMEEWSSSAHVEWVFHYPKDLRSVTSPEFRTGNQCYLLEMSVEPDAIYLLLYRKGPRMQGPRRNARCWAGLRCGDGSYYCRNLRGKLKLNTECKTWCLVKRLCDYKTYEVQRKLISPCGKLTAFLRLSLDGSSDAFINHPSLLSNQGDGIIREHERIFSKEVEWTTDFVTDQENWVSVSHEFMLGEEQHFLLQLTVEPDEERKYLVLNLFRFGPEASRRILWWAGQKRADGSYYYKVVSGELNVPKKFEMWRCQQRLWRIKTSELEKNHLVADGKIVIFLRLIQETTEAFFSRFVELSALGTGTIRQDCCATHTEVEWQIRDIPREIVWTVSSPEFEVGKQRFLLEITKYSTKFCLTLYRMGPSVDSTVRFWAGLAVSDSTNYGRINSGMFSLKDNFEVWKEVKCLYNISELDLNRKYFSPFQCIAFFLNLEPPSDSPKIVYRQATVSNGNIQIEVCPSHAVVKWNVDYEEPKKWDCDWSLTSSLFRIENQHYLLQLSSFSYTITELGLYRIGPSVDGPAGSVRWWLGIDCRDADKIYRNRRGELDLKGECWIWKKVKRLRIVDRDVLDLGGNLCFSFCLRLQRSSNSSDECIHASRVMALPRSGHIEEEEWPACKKVEWQIDYVLMSAGKRILTSPEISIGNRRFILDLCSVDRNWVVSLFRRETTEGGPARWCLGVRRFAGHYDHYHSISGILDFKQSCDVWTKVEEASLFLSEEYKLNKMMHLTITFVLLWDQVSNNTEVCDNAIKVLSNSRHLDSGDIVFKVQDKEFKEHIAVLSVRVPALEAMFRFDSAEKRTGLVNIGDCDPITFERFLKYVGTEELPAMSTNEIFELFTLADKYLLQSLKSRCLKQIKYETLCADTICDLLELISRCEALDFSESVSKFLNTRSQHVNVEIGAWKTFEKVNGQIAFHLETGNLKALISSTRRSLGQQLKNE